MDKVELRINRTNKDSSLLEEEKNFPYVVTTNLFLAPPQGCHVSAHGACFLYLKRRSPAYASSTPSPALVNWNGTTAPRGRLRSGNPSSIPDQTRAPLPVHSCTTRDSSISRHRAAPPQRHATFSNQKIMPHSAHLKLISKGTSEIEVSTAPSLS